MITLKDKNKGTVIIEDIIANGRTHCHYSRVVNLMEDYKRMFTGVGTEKWLGMFFREDEDMWRARLNVSTPIVKCVLNNIGNRVKKISRIQNVKKTIIYQDKGDYAEDLGNYVKNYAVHGLEKYLEHTVLYNGLIDPNGFLVTLLKKEKGEIKPYINFLSCKEVLDYEYNELGELEWMVSKICKWGYDGDRQKREYKDFYLYGGDIILRYAYVSSYDERTNAKVLRTDFEEKSTGEYKQVGTDWYWVETYTPMASKVQAIRVGHILDPETENETCISLIDPAMPRLIKVVRSGSNLDLAISLNIFPQKYSYEPPCTGTPENRCIDGYLIDGSKCPVCEGTGRKNISQPDKRISFLLPENPEDVYDLSKLVFYASIDIKSVEFLDNYVTKLENRVYVDIYNTELISHSNSNLKSIGDVTAYEIGSQREDRNDTLLPFAQQFAAVYEYQVGLFSEYRYPKKVSSKMDINYEFPKDLKLSTFGEMMVDLKSANDSGAPPSVIQQLTDDIIHKVTDGDDIAQKKIQVKSKLIPFLGWNVKSVEAALLSGTIDWDDAITYYGQDIIFGDLENENPGLYTLPQKEIELKFDAYIKEYISNVKASAKERIKLNAQNQEQNGNKNNQSTKNS